MKSDGQEDERLVGSGWSWKDPCLVRCNRPFLYRTWWRDLYPRPGVVSQPGT
jgi:hypothetical protein